MLTTTDRRVQYTGDDQTKNFTFNFRVWDKSQIKVYQANEDEEWSETDITGQCEVEINDDNTGTVKFTSAPKNGITIAIVREMPFIQEDEYINGTRFNPEEIEDRFDQDCAERQELLDGLDRAIKVPNTSTQTPEEVYETLVEGSALIQSYINELTEIYNSILQLYGEFKGEIGEVSYLANSEISWVIKEEDISSDTVDIPDGVQYREGTHQLHVDVDGVVAVLNEDYEEVKPKEGSEYSTQLRFKAPLYNGQRIHVRTSFLGSVAFTDLLNDVQNQLIGIQTVINETEKDFKQEVAELQQEAEGIKDEVIQIAKDAEKEFQEELENFKQEAEEIKGEIIQITEEAEEEFQQKLENFEQEAEGIKDEVIQIAKDAEEEFQRTIEDAYQVIEDVSALLGDANAINELREQSFLLTQQLSQYSALPYQICQLNTCTDAISQTICAYTNPQDGVCILSSNYEANCCVGLPICYYPNTCTLHVAIDGVVLSCCDYREVTNGSDSNGSGQSSQIQTCVCLYSGQELHAWTEPYWCNCIDYKAPEQTTSCEYEGCCYENCTNSAICVSNNSCGCVLYSCFICNCGDNGGAICNQSNLFVCESAFLCNCACGEASAGDGGEGDEEERDPHSNGGAIAVLGDGYVYLSNSCFEDNCACTDGGMFYASCGETFASSITACCNTANCHGGAIAVTTVTCLNYNCGTLEGNCAATGSGGALCATCTCLAISGGSISNNCACECGGALALFDCSRAIVCNACIMNNTANYGGGIYVCDNSRAYIYCSCFDGNCDCCIGESEEEEAPFTPMGYDVYLDCNSCTILCNIIFGHSEEADGSGEATEESELMVADEEEPEAATCGGVYIGCGSCATVSGTTYLYNGLICIPSDGHLTVNGCLILCNSYICYIDNCGCVCCGSQGCIDCCGSSCVCCVEQEEEDGDPPEGEPDDDDNGGSNGDQGGIDEPDDESSNNQQGSE